VDGAPLAAMRARATSSAAAASSTTRLLTRWGEEWPSSGSISLRGVRGENTGGAVEGGGVISGTCLSTGACVCCLTRARTNWEVHIGRRFSSALVAAVPRRHASAAAVPAVPTAPCATARLHASLSIAVANGHGRRYPKQQQQQQQQQQQRAAAASSGSKAAAAPRRLIELEGCVVELQGVRQTKKQREGRKASKREGSRFFLGCRTAFWFHQL